VVSAPGPDRKRVAIEFIDTGAGIPREAQAKIFDPFFTTKKTGEGTGLGLSMSYGIVTKFGGNIVFSSYPADEYPEKHGTTFTVYLPVISGPEAEAAARDTGATPEAAPISLEDKAGG
jgi:signal transduction histidine kinase